MKPMLAALPQRLHQSLRPAAAPSRNIPNQPYLASGPSGCLHAALVPMQAKASCRPVLRSGSSPCSSKAAWCSQSARMGGWQTSRSMASRPAGHSPSPPASSSSSATTEASEQLSAPPADAPAPDAAKVEEEAAAAAADPAATDAAAAAAEEAEQHKQRVREAVLTGTLGFGFSAGGFLYCYHLGVLWELERLGVLRQGNGTLMAGASAGSLAIATFNSGISASEARSALRAFAHDCRTAGTRYRLSGLLREFLHSYLPPDAHERCSGVCHVSLTRVPSMRHEAISQFHDKDDLVQALLTSCHIPVYASGAWTTQFRGSTYVDGGITHFVPSPPSPTVIKVCCFPVSGILARMKPTIKDMRRASSLMSIAVSPDAFEDCEPSFRTLVKWALVPAEDEVLDWLMDKGRRDAGAWAESLGLTDLVVQPPAVLFP